ncbi:PAS domain S-box protein [Streptomyces albofaciens JCM 4342]|uniref:SpoIIE family protein phosphatase n=1 Tax=Streptomyces albofaciens TaxID=66866 RepID=UPI00123A484E|nr:SpoIIE family protein phosphatase [Streptomyces albofaciens]KAA6212399.1 PAS domain S-box protein [Streptomyces albofaciens JCM 4342]
MDHSSQPEEASSRSFPPRPESVASARRFVRAALAGADPHAVGTAELLASELVTNAVLHARTEIAVSARAVDGEVRVRIGDRQPCRALVPQRSLPYAGPGQGLALVEELASAYGVENGDEGKTVWFALRRDERPPPPHGWRTTTARTCGPTRTVTLVDLPGALYLAAQRHQHALLRELTLAAFAGTDTGVRPEDLAVAHDMNNVLSAGMTAALEEQSSVAHTHSLDLSLPADAARALPTLRQVLDAAERLARNERLLAWPSLPHNRVFRQWLFDQIAGQFAGGPPTAWTVIPREPSASPSELVPWDASHAWASRVPTIAADDENRIIVANGPAADLLGWQTGELVGERLTVLIPEHLRKRHMAAFTRLLRTGQPHILGRSVPLPALHRDGRLVPVRLFVQSQGTADGRTVFVAQLAPRTAPPVPAPLSPGEDRAASPEQPHGPDLLEEPERVATSAGGDAGDGPALERRLLADIGESLSSTPNLDEGLQRVCKILTRRLADWCMVDLLNDFDQLERFCVAHHGPTPLPAEAYAGRLPPVTGAARGPLARVLRGAGPLLLTEPPAPSEVRSPLDAHYAELFERVGANSAVVAPLRTRGAVFGALTLVQAGRNRPFTEDSLPLIGDLVRSLALGVEHARLYQETRHIAERLQRSLLPVLPEIGHLQMAARYAPSSTTAQIGGDWYDSFVVPGGQTAAVIGDVAGHDLEAAVAMSQLRSMLRGIAIDRQEPPAEVMRRLDMANHTLSQEATATCIYALVTGPPDGPWELKHSSAGHLPPLLTTREGDTRYLDGGSGLLLGMDPDLPRPSATDALPAHSTVLLYTDGLIERRDESLDHAMDRLRRHTAALAGEPLDVFCDELLIGLSADSADDIALLAIRPVPQV